MQPYWAYQHYVAHFFVLHPLASVIPPALVVASLVILLKYKNIVVQSSTAAQR
jgi:hypothetical protein